MLRENPYLSSFVVLRTKARIFQKVDSFSRVHNRMDKLTLTRQFWIQLGIFLGRYRKEIEMEYISS